MGSTVSKSVDNNSIEMDILGRNGGGAQGGTSSVASSTLRESPMLSFFTRFTRGRERVLEGAKDVGSAIITVTGSLYGAEMLGYMVANAGLWSIGEAVAGSVIGRAIGEDENLPGVRVLKE